MAHKRLSPGIVGAIIGWFLGSFVTGRRKRAEIRTLREIIQQNQDANLRRMQNQRDAQDDEAT